jgi:hypothetical protein
MSISFIEITGLRGFAETGRIYMARPDGKRGSGITILVGPNNGGKSTVIEAFAAMSHRDPKGETEEPSIPVGKRNLKAGGRVLLRACPEDGECMELRTVEAGGALMQSRYALSIGAYVLPARRFFNPYFEKFPGYMARSTYTSMGPHPTLRNSALERFNERIFKAHGSRERFDEVFGRIVGATPRWNIEQADDGRHFLQFRFGEVTHSSDGIGDGLLNAWFISDALYDSSEDEVIAIDEPELSLFPGMQKRVLALLAEYARDRQIIYATHSPYFVGWDMLANGARVARVHKRDERTVVSELSRDTIERLSTLTLDKNNPHILGLNANEVFFLDDGIILVEGQEDVVFYQLIADQMNYALPGEFFGWGVGGAEKMTLIAQMLYELGFRRVVGILDKGKEAQKEELGATFPDFRFFIIPASDVRTKKARKAVEEREGLVVKVGKEHRLQEKYRAELERMFGEMKNALGGRHA